MRVIDPSATRSRVEELFGAEPVFGGVVEQPLVGGPGQGVGGDFFEVEPASRFQYPDHLGDCGAPVGVGGGRSVPVFTEVISRRRAPEPDVRLSPHPALRRSC